MTEQELRPFIGQRVAFDLDGQSRTDFDAVEQFGPLKTVEDGFAVWDESLGTRRIALDKITAVTVLP